MLTLKFDIYHKNKKTGRVEIENGKLIKNEVYTDNPIIEHICPNSKTLDNVLAILQSRVLCKDRCEPWLLEALGLKEYNVYDILRKTHGIDRDDYLWLKFDDDPSSLCWDGVKVRD